MTASPRQRASSLDELDSILAQMSDPEAGKASIVDFLPRPTDVVITPFGKSGTTWTQQIVHTLRTRGDMDFDDISRVVPWIETSRILGLNINAEQRATPRAFKSHLDFDKVPKGATYINVIRNPVDAAYSAFKFMEAWFIEPGTITADAFVTGRVANGGYEKHLTSWWPRRDDENVLYLVFEHMKQDLEGTIEQVAAFIGIDLDQELRNMTLEHASLPFMQKHKDRFDDALMRERSEKSVLPAGSDSSKVRAGQVGDHGLSEETVETIAGLWRELVTPETGFDTYEALVDSLR
ncbi:MAG: sulfotransferase domain-containing protein [Acidimicrobiales bacterium]